ncbi:tetratricopeptide repeat protein [Phaeospirillum tilakii]|uniref:Tetratricopeptide repeat protein n=1 Tax=Phaeospirillum tilakii TaxID=741673 RepID=A0ABW5CFH0_9PROT
MNSRDLTADLALATRLEQEGRLDQAEALCRAMLFEAPDHPAVLHLLALLLCRTGRLDQGEALLADLSAHAPDDPALLRPLAEAQAARGRHAAAADSFARLTQVRPGDPEALLGLGQARQALGDAAAALGCYLTAIGLAPTMPRGHFLLAILFQQQGRLEQAAAACQQAIDLAPGRAGHHLTLGNIRLDQGRLDEAQAAFGQAAALQPDWPDALTNLGLAWQRRGDLDQALALQRRAVACGPDDLTAWTNLAATLQLIGRPFEAVGAYERAAALAPTDPLTLSNLAQALDEAGRDDDALEVHRRAVAAGPDCAVARFNRGVTLLRRGDGAEGWTEYGWRWRGGVPRLTPRGFAQPEWRGEPLDGATLLLHAEQGFGDTLQFVRFLPQAAARGGRILLETQPPLAGLLADAFPGLPVIARGEPLPPFDRHLPLLSLPAILGSDEGAAMPYLRAEPAAAAGWTARLAGPGRAVGLAWSGNPAHRADRLRSIPAAQMLDRLAAAPVRLFALQKDPRPADAAVLAAEAARITDLGPELVDFRATAAILAGLDLVITVDTALAHLAGAMGRPVWLLLPFSADWRWRHRREDSPWYPSMRLFRQSEPGDWDEVFDRVAAALG